VKRSAIELFHYRLHQWYAAHGRHDLPWRKTSDPYAIWVSEVMLQQTQVKTVWERFYFPFLKRFPTVESLAKAHLDEVLQLWQGLGYYSRARNLHAAAQQIANGVFPNTVEQLVVLPGIGRNTAHAIAAFAYHQPHPVMEANVKRVICRIFAQQEADHNTLWPLAEKLLDRANPFDYNQAMMDIGALICTPRRPQCPLCPANIICKGQTDPEHYPAKKRKAPVPTRYKRIVLFQDSVGRFYMEQRQDKFLHGLWRFAEYDATAKSAAFHSADYSFTEMHKLGDIVQVYSHFHLEAEVYLIPLKMKGKGVNWKSRAEINGLALSGAERKVLALLIAADHENPLLRQKIGHV
jgi:A/G-specific adenine glycosylase